MTGTGRMRACSLSPPRGRPRSSRPSWTPSLPPRPSPSHLRCGAAHPRGPCFPRKPSTCGSGSSFLPSHSPPPSVPAQQPAEPSAAPHPPFAAASTFSKTPHDPAFGGPLTGIGNPNIPDEDAPFGGLLPPANLTLIRKKPAGGASKPSKNYPEARAAATRGVCVPPGVCVCHPPRQTSPVSEPAPAPPSLPHARRRSPARPSRSSAPPPPRPRASPPAAAAPPATSTRLPAAHSASRANSSCADPKPPFQPPHTSPSPQSPPPCQLVSRLTPPLPQQGKNGRYVGNLRGGVPHGKGQLWLPTGPGRPERLAYEGDWHMARRPTPTACLLRPITLSPPDFLR